MLAPALGDKNRGIRDFLDEPKQDEIRLECWQKHYGQQLTAGQKEVLNELDDLRRISTTKNSLNRSTLAEEYNKAIRRAIRLKLGDHPWCIDWILIKWAFGDRKSLHALHRDLPNLEKGIKKPIGISEMKLLERIFKLKKKGLSLRSIHKILQRKDQYGNSWATFQEWLANPERAAIIEPLSI